MAIVHYEAKMAAEEEQPKDVSYDDLPPEIRGMVSVRKIDP